MKIRSLIRLLYIFFLCMTSCNQEETNQQPGTDQFMLTENPKGNKMVVYQMMTRLFTNTNTTNKVWGTAAENGVGKFNEINEKALQGLKALGATHVWFTGVIEHAVVRDYTEYGISLDDADVVKGRAGSPYAIKDYYDVNPDLAEDVPNRMAEFEALVARTHQTGLKVLIDFVPNHVARNYVSDAQPEGTEAFGMSDDIEKAFDPNNNFYYLPGESFQVPEGYEPLGEAGNFPTKDGKFAETPAKATGNDVFSAAPSINDWFETVKLNYGVDIQQERKTYFDPIPDTWLKMRDILLYWAGKGVDGFRCDMAEMVPAEFWQWCIAEVKKAYPDLVFIAEIYNPAAYNNYIEQGGFDFLYDKVQLYDSLKYIMQGTGSTHELTQIWQSQQGIMENLLHFMENHDEQRIASPGFAGSAQKGIPAMMVSAAMHTGPIMVYFGQEVGEPGAGAEGFGGDDGRTTIFDYWGVPEHQKWVNNGAYDGGMLSAEQQKLRAFYHQLLNFCKTSEAIGKGSFFNLHAFNLALDAETSLSDKTYSFLRLSEQENLLVTSNFSDEAQVVKLQLPKALMERFGVSEIQELDFSLVVPTETGIAPGYRLESGYLKLELPPNGAGILSITPSL